MQTAGVGVAFRFDRSTALHPRWFFVAITFFFWFVCIHQIFLFQIAFRGRLLIENLLKNIEVGALFRIFVRFIRIVILVLINVTDHRRIIIDVIVRAAWNLNSVTIPRALVLLNNFTLCADGGQASRRLTYRTARTIVWRHRNRNATGRCRRWINISLQQKFKTQLSIHKCMYKLGVALTGMNLLEM